MTTLDKTTRDVVITPKRGLLDIGLYDVWGARDLIALFVNRNFVVNYRQTVLGPLWYLAQPLITTAIYTLVFSVIVRLPTDSVPPILFYLSGGIMWTNFSTNLMTTSDVFVANMGLFGKVYFPRLAVPVATTITNLITLALHFIVFCCVYLIMIWRGEVGAPTIWFVLSPLLFLVNTLLAFGCGLILSALTTRYRDLTSMVGSAMQLWMYATPVIYPLSQIPASWRPYLALNPISTSIELFRYVLFGTGSISLSQVLVSISVVISILVIGLVLFNRADRFAADTV